MGFIEVELRSAVYRIQSQTRSKGPYRKTRNFCQETYLLILDTFPWVSISPNLHKFLAHAEELIRDWNSSYGLKSLSGVGVESFNILVRRYRETFLLEKLFRVKCYGHFC